MKQKREEDMDFDELLNWNTQLQCSRYYNIMKWNHDNKERIREKAYELYVRRVENGIPGNELADWYEAKSFLLLLEFIK